MSFCSGNVHEHWPTPNSWAKIKMRDAILPSDFARIAILSPMNWQPTVNITESSFWGWGRSSIWQLKHQGEGTRAEVHPGQKFCLLQQLGSGVHTEQPRGDRLLGLLSHSEVILESQIYGTTGSIFAFSVPDCFLNPVTCDIPWEGIPQLHYARREEPPCFVCSILPPASFISCSLIFDNSRFLSTS